MKEQLVYVVVNADGVMVSRPYSRKHYAVAACTYKGWKVLALKVSGGAVVYEG